MSKIADIQDYRSSLDDPRSRRFGTFSYLPGMDADRLQAQIDYRIARGWAPAIEHVEASRAADDYWYMWKLPMFGERDVDTVMNELTACRNANPGHHVRLVGYDNKRQTQGLAMAVYRGDG